MTVTQTAPAAHKYNRLLLPLIWALLLAFLALVIILSLQAAPESRLTEERVVAQADPEQTALPALEPILLEDGTYSWRMAPRAEYRVAARVLGLKRYWDWQSRFAPVDLALGWGAVSDPAVDKEIRWAQAQRWYSYRWSGEPPLPPHIIRDQSANVHIIPATDNLDSAIRQLRPNDIVLLEGLLVDVEGGPAGQIQQVKTSLTRTDTGEGACEIFYVERLVVDGREYH